MVSARQCTATRRLGQPSTLRRFSLCLFLLLPFLFSRARGVPGPAATRAQFLVTGPRSPVSQRTNLSVLVTCLLFACSPAHPLRVPLRECSEGCVIARIVFGPFRFDLNALYCKRTRIDTSCMAADVMQGCRPGSAQLLGGLGGRLRLAYSFILSCLPP